MAPASKSTDPKDLLKGGVLQCLEAISVGMPFEVWKTHMGTYREQGTIESFRNIYQKGGVAGFWRGWQPKVVESFLKGGILLFAKESIIRASLGVGMTEVYAGLLGGFGGGVAQVTVMGPCTFLVTAAVTGDKSQSIFEKAKSTWATRGIKGFYSGGTALMLRQGSNWASRQGFTEYVRKLLKERHDNPSNAKLSIAEESLAGIIGGALSTWNQPFEVMRIEAQAAAAKGLPSRSITKVCGDIVKESGVVGLFQGIYPRMGLCIAQTLFMVSVPHVLKQYGL